MLEQCLKVAIVVYVLVIAGGVSVGGWFNASKFSGYRIVSKIQLEIQTPRC